MINNGTQIYFSGQMTNIVIKKMMNKRIKVNTNMIKFSFQGKRLKLKWFKMDNILLWLLALIVLRK